MMILPLFYGARIYFHQAFFYFDLALDNNCLSVKLHCKSAQCSGVFD